jgi:hypothetical protein
MVKEEEPPVMQSSFAFQQSGNRLALLSPAMRLMIIVFAFVALGIWDLSQNHGRLLSATAAAGWFLLRQAGLA